MKKLLYLIFIASFFSCDQPKPIKSKAKDRKPNKIKYHKLFDQYFSIGIDTLWMYSPDDSLTAYNGRAIDSVNALFFPSNMAQRFRDSSKHLNALISVTQGHDNSVDNTNDTTIVEIRLLDPDRSVKRSS